MAFNSEQPTYPYESQSGNPSFLIDEIEEEDGDVSLDSQLLESPTIQRSKPASSLDTNGSHPFKLPPDLKFLASVNFSSESVDQMGLSMPTQSNNTAFGGGGSFSPGINHHRRYSNSSLMNSPTAASRNAPNTRPRPRSAVFLMESNSTFADMPSPVQQTTPRSGRVAFAGRNNNYTPTHGSHNYNYQASGAPPMGPTSSILSRNPSPTRSTSPSRAGRQFRSKSPVRRSNSPTKYQPFNFKPQEMMMQSNGSNQSLSVKPAQRKGHKYKHSSVSMNLFQEPPPAIIQQTAIPDLFPIPNFSELFSSLKPQQNFKLICSLGHSALCVVIFLVGYHFKLPTFSTLAHLVFYDSLGSLVMVFVEIMSNFEVWNKSSIAYPFGLGRLEVLVGFALSTSLVMVGCDLVSHILEELVILFVVHDSSDEQHQSHHIHADKDEVTNWFVYEVMLIIVVVATVLTSQVVLASDRINDMISATEETPSPRKKQPEHLKKGLLESQTNNTSLMANVKIVWGFLANNPTRLLTLLYTVFLMVLPIIPVQIIEQVGIDVDEATTLSVAVLLCYIGWKLVKNLGGILLLSYPRSTYDYDVLRASIMDKILTLECYKLSYNVDKLFITKFNYELFIAGVKITMKNASVDDELRLKFEVNRLLKECISQTESTGRKSVIETTLDFTRC